VHVAVLLSKCQSTHQKTQHGTEDKKDDIKEDDMGKGRKKRKLRGGKGGKRVTKQTQIRSIEINIPGPLLEASAAGRQDELRPVLLGEQSSPGVLALSSQLSKLHQIIELFVHILGATHQL